MNLEKDYPTKPRMINTDKDHWWSTFGNYETEVSAKYLVEMAQERGGWEDFTQQEIDDFSGEDFWFNDLLKDGYIKKIGEHRQVMPGNKFAFTHKFIARCFEKYPKNQ